MNINYKVRYKREGNVDIFDGKRNFDKSAIWLIYIVFVNSI